MTLWVESQELLTRNNNGKSEDIVMPLMGSLYIGNSGLTTAQNALNITAHNISNVDTTGYVRQQVYQATRFYNTLSIDYDSVASQQYGTGASVAATRQVRDYFLDQSYREEVGRCNFYEISYGVMEEVELLLGELNEVAFQDSLENLYTAIQELSKQPESAVTQGLLVQTCTAFLERSQSVYQGLSEYQDNLNSSVVLMTNQINTYGNQIKLLNDQIRNIEAGGIEQANDLRDARNQLLDELSALANISYTEDSTGTVTVKLEGEPFVAESSVYEMGLHYDNTTGFATPFWPHNAKVINNADGTQSYDISESGKVFNMNQVISSDLDTDIGGLKAILLARGDHRGTYEDLQDKDFYNSEISQSVIMNMQAQFDQLIYNVVTMINDVFAEAADPATGYLCGEDGEPFQMFQSINEDTPFTTASLFMNSELVQEPSLLGFVKADGSVDYETIEKLKEAFESAEYTLNPNVLNPVDIMGFYSALVAQVGNSGYVYKAIMEYQQETVESIENARQGLHGVSSDEEMSNMIKFQNAYNAASRYINVIDEMLEHLINKLA